MSGASSESFNCEFQRAPKWLERARLCADLLGRLPDEVLSLADIGCGDRKLRSTLEDRGLRLAYHGYDLKPQSAEVRRFDVRSDELPAGHDVAVMLGVIEYLEDVESVLQSLRGRVGHLLLSHVLKQAGPQAEQRARDYGWVTQLTEDELRGALAAAGWSVVERAELADKRSVVWLCRA